MRNGRRNQSQPRCNPRTGRGRIQRQRQNCKPELKAERACSVWKGYGKAVVCNPAGNVNVRVRRQGGTWVNNGNATRTQRRPRWQVGESPSAQASGSSVAGERSVRCSKWRVRSSERYPPVRGTRHPTQELCGNQAQSVHQQQWHHHHHHPRCGGGACRYVQQSNQLAPTQT